MYNKHGKKRQFVPILNINDLKKDIQEKIKQVDFS